MAHKISSRGLELFLLAGIVLVAGFFLRDQSVVPLRVPDSTEREHLILQFDPTLVRVNITPRSRSDWVLEIPGDYTVRTPASPVSLGSGSHLKPTRIQFRNLRWELPSSPKSHSLPQKSMEIIPQKGGFFRLNDRRFRGTLLLTATRSGRPVLVNQIDLESYVATVVDGEMPLSFGRQARCAQAIVARSFVLSKRRESVRKSIPYDVYADTRSQYYPGFQYQGRDGKWYAGESQDGRDCAAETQGLVCLHQGHLVCTYYSAVCGGATQNGRALFPDAASVIVSVQCLHCNESPLYRWEKKLQLDRFQSRIQEFLRSRGAGALNWGNWKSLPTEQGQLPYYEIPDTVRTHRFSGLDLRNLWGGDLLPSPIMKVDLQSHQVAISGAGHGHGVGLCQWGAKGLAAKGKTFREILNFYYPGIDIAPYSVATGRSASDGGGTRGKKDSHANSPVR